MTATLKNPRAPSRPTARQVAQRQARIRDSWSPRQRRERAWEAAARMMTLWAITREPEPA